MRGVKLRDLFPLLRDAFLAFGQDRAPRLAAALAYYTIFSLAPLLFLMFSIAGIFLGGSDVAQNLFGVFNEQGELVRAGTLTESVGEDTARFLEDLASNQNLRQSGIIASIFGFVTLFMGATGLFAQLQDALNSLWGADPAPVSGFWRIIRTRLVAFGLVLLFATLILVFVVGNTVLAAFAQQLGNTIGLGALFARVGSILLSTALFSLVFAMIYKYLPDVRLSWRDVWTGAIVTAFLFTIGQVLIGIYFGRVSPGSVFGAAGSLVVLLLWIYYSSMLIFFGAEVTWVYAQKFGSAPGGAMSPAKKAALAQKGATVPTGVSPKEREAIQATKGVVPPTATPYAAQAQGGGAMPEPLRDRGGPSRGRAAPLPGPGRLLSQTLFTLLALPALPVVMLVRALSRR